MPRMRPKWQAFGMTSSRTRLGKHLRSKRRKAGLSQIEAASLADMSQSCYSSLETGKKRFCTQDQADRLSRVLATSTEELIALSRTRRKPRLVLTSLGVLIEHYREKQGLTRAQLSARLGRSKYYMNSVVRHHHCINRHDHQLWCRALKCDPGVLEPFLLWASNYRQPESEVGQRIRDRRRELKLSQEQLAHKIHTTRAHISLIEIGRITLTRNPRLVGKLNRALKLGMGKLAYWVARVECRLDKAS